MKKYQLLLLLLLFGAEYASFSQQPDSLQPPVIQLRNPSFENETGKSPDKYTVVKDWTDCGFNGYTPPEIQPGRFAVIIPPNNGKNYISMVTRPDGTYESLGQQLTQPLLKGGTYLWHIDLASSDEMRSPTIESNGQEIMFNDLVKFYVWGGNDICEEGELLDSTRWIDHTGWKRYTFVLSPKISDYSFLRIETNTGVHVMPKTCGNVLVDNASPIIPLKRVLSDSLSVDFLRNWITPYPLSEPWNALPASGSICILDGLTFYESLHGLRPSQSTSLYQLYENLKAFPDLKIEIGAHTSSLEKEAGAVSSKHAQIIANWLIKKGIAPNRIKYKDYGKLWLSLFDEEGRVAPERNRILIKIL